MPPVRSFVEHMYGIVVILGKPKSRGVVRLGSADASEAALVDPRYFYANEDLETLVKGVELARHVGASAPLRDWGNLELMPGKWVNSQKKLGDWIRKNVMTTYHFSGTCKMGPSRDPLAVACTRESAIVVGRAHFQLQHERVARRPAARQRLRRTLRRLRRRGSGARQATAVPPRHRRSP